MSTTTYILGFQPVFLALLAALAGTVLADLRGEPEEGERRVAAVERRRGWDFAPAGSLATLWVLLGSFLAVVAVALTLSSRGWSGNLHAVAYAAGVVGVLGGGTHLALARVARRPAAVSSSDGVGVDQALRRQTGHSIAAAAVAIAIMFVGSAGRRLIEIIDIAVEGNHPIAAIPAALASVALSVGSILVALIVWVKLCQADIGMARQRRMPA